jgi:alkanesulfonate monooxygenase SsuD/methylene tetrahydromethanopterin reductase-like flavin-dependent oxidoreductase (luciferase family)
MDPFVTLTAASMATETLKISTGVCLIAQRDPIRTAKLAGSIDQLSRGRFLRRGTGGVHGAIRDSRRRVAGA